MAYGLNSIERMEEIWEEILWEQFEKEWDEYRDYISFKLELFYLYPEDYGMAN